LTYAGTSHREHGSDVAFVPRVSARSTSPAPLRERRSHGETRRGALSSTTSLKPLAEQHAILPAQLELANLYAGGPRATADDAGSTWSVLRCHPERRPRLGDAPPQRLALVNCVGTLSRKRYARE
jgi:hypothetical protein